MKRIFPMQKKMLGIGLGIVAMAVVVFLLLSRLSETTNLPSNSSLPAEFIAGRTLWNKQHLDDYRMTVLFEWGDAVTANITFTVMNNNPIKAEIKTSQLYIASPITTPEWYRKSLSKVFLPNLEDYSMDKLFDFISMKLQTQPSIAVGTPHYVATIDEDRGYLNSLTYDVYNECPDSPNSGAPTGCHEIYKMSILDLQSMDGDTSK